MVSRGAKQQVPSRIRGTSEAGQMLRQHKDHEKRPRFTILRRKSKVFSHRDGGRWRWCVSRSSTGSCEFKQKEIENNISPESNCCSNLKKIKNYGVPEKDISELI